MASSSGKRVWKTTAERGHMSRKGRLIKTTGMMGTENAAKLATNQS